MSQYRDNIFYFLPFSTQIDPIFSISIIKRRISVIIYYSCALAYQWHYHYPYCKSVPLTCIRITKPLLILNATLIFYVTFFLGKKIFFPIQQLVCIVFPQLSFSARILSVLAADCSTLFFASFLLVSFHGLYHLFCL